MSRAGNIDGAGIKPPGGRPPNGRRVWLSRILLACAAPLLTLALAESGLRICGYGHTASYFVRGIVPGTLMSNQDFGLRFFGPTLNRMPIPTVITPRKSPNTYRIFVFGSSAAQGMPSPAFSFARILEAMLNDRFPGTRFEVINTGMTAVNSHAILPIMRGCRGLDGDLYVIYTGNNEVVGPYGAATVFGPYTPSLAAIRASVWAKATRTGQLASSVARRLSGAAANRGWSGMKMFLDQQVAADDPRLQRTYRNFEANLQAMLSEARRAGASVLAATVVTNLRDCPPFISVHRPDLSPEDRERCEGHDQRGFALQQAGQSEAALREYQAALQIDDRFAELHYRSGQCLLALERVADARTAFVRARDLDALRFRADSGINGIIRRVSRGREAQAVHLVDVETALAAQAPDGIPGAGFLYEHVHFNFEGNYAVAAELFRALQGILPPGLVGPNRGMEPPTLERCAALTLFTPYDRAADALVMLRITSEPPFPKARGTQDKADAERLKAQVSEPLCRAKLEACEQRLAERPDDLLARVNFSQLLMFRSDYARAIEQCRAVLARYPDRECRLRIAKALLGQNRVAEAVIELRSLLKAAPGSSQARWELGNALVRQGRIEEGIAEYRRALAARPEDATGHVILGTVLLDKAGRPAEAERCFAEAIRLDPTRAPYHYDLGTALLRQGKPLQAVEPLRRATELEPTAALLHYNLAMAYKELGQLESARRSYRRAVELDPKYARPPYEIKGGL